METHSSSAGTRGIAFSPGSEAADLPPSENLVYRPETKGRTQEAHTKSGEMTSPPFDAVPAVVSMCSRHIVSATEMSAIAASLVMGRCHETRDVGGTHLASIKRPDTVAPFVVAQVLANLRAWPCCATLRCVDDRYRESVPKIKAHLNAIERDNMVYGTNGTSRADLVCCPVDGLRDLCDGFDGGTVSAIAFAPDGTFNASLPAAAERFLVVALKGNAADLEKTITDKLDHLKEQKRDVQLAEVAQTLLQAGGGVLETIRVFANKPATQLTIGTMDMDEEDFRILGPLIRPFCRMHVFRGSSIAAALTTFLHNLGIDAFVAVVRLTQLMIIAAGAQALGSSLFAIPLAIRKEQIPSKKRRSAKISKGNKQEHRTVYRRYFLSESKNFYKSDELVLQRGVFLSLTGVNENLLVQGVRFRDHTRITTQTLCIDGATRSTVNIRTHHDLEHRGFPSLNKATHKPLRKWDELVDGFGKWFDSPGSQLPV